MRTIELNPLSFIGSPDEKRFILLRSQKADKDESFLEDFALPKILNRDGANKIPGVWGTLGYKSNTPIDWSGNLQCSNEGNDDFDKDSPLYKEIEYLKYMYPGLQEKGEIQEKVIDLRNLDIDLPPVFDLEDIPELRLDIFLDEDEGALAFYQLRKEHVSEQNIEFIQPQATDANTTNRDRLTYHFKVVPKKELVPVEELPSKYMLSGSNSEDDFIIKVLIFKRKLPNNQLPTSSTQIISALEEQIEKESGNLFAKKHRLLYFKKRAGKFKVARKGKVDPKLKTLLLIHGTFASTKGSFGEVYNWIESLLDQGIYEQVIAFDHPTLFDDAEENVKELFEIFYKLKITKFTQDVDLIGTSQGGLIAQYLANHPNSFLPIGKVALVASANGVGYLTFADNLTKGLKLLRKVMTHFGMAQGAMISALLQHSINWVITRKGLDLMRPGSERLNDIMFTPPIRETTRYLPIVGNHTAQKEVGKVLEWAIDKVLDKENDWVVSTKNQFRVPSAYAAIQDYNPAKFRDHAITNRNALHGRLIEDPEVQMDIEEFFENANYLQIRDVESENLDQFDAHCHLFGRSVVSGRIVVMLLADLLDYFKDDNPDELLPPIDLREEGDHDGKFGTTLKNILKYFILNKDAHDMLHDLERDYFNSTTTVYRYVPLMFDLEMTFKNAYAEDDALENLHKVSDAFNGEHKKMVERIEGLLNKADKGTKVFSGSQAQNDESLKILKRFSWAVKQLRRINNTLDKDTKDSFEKQVDELTKLKFSYGEDVFPFLATDPRRNNMGNIIKGQLGENGAFHGIKIYSPNGYSPTDKNFMDPALEFTHGTSLYQWCVDTSTPVMAHNSDAGFATFTDRLEVNGDICTGDKNPDGTYKLVQKEMEFIDFRYNLFQGGFGKAVKERAHTLNHPTLWGKVLETYPQLKICLAHFGGGSEEWQKEIAKLIVKYDNVYTDLSCQTEKKRLEEIYNAYFTDDSSENVKIRSRIMYGSDYFLNLLQGKKFSDYYENFTVVFDPEEIDYMSVHVPKTYLGINE